MSVEVVTFGCRLNTYESEVIRESAVKAGMDNAIIFNTCAVTAEAERQARQAIRRARRDNPHATILVTGCSAQVKPQSYAQMDEVDRVLGNEEKLKASSYSSSPEFRDSETIGGSRLQKVDGPIIGFANSGHDGHPKILVNDIMSVRETAAHMVTSFEGRARAFVQVQNGCDHRCTFCIIPYGRGNSRSVPVGEIVAQVRMLVEQG